MYLCRNSISQRVHIITRLMHNNSRISFLILSISTRDRVDFFVLFRDYLSFVIMQGHLNFRCVLCLEVVQRPGLIFKHVLL